MYEITIKRPNHPIVSNTVSKEQLKAVTTTSNTQEKWQWVFDHVDRNGSVLLKITTAPGTTIEIRKKFSA
jgi:hypothetical protein